MKISYIIPRYNEPESVIKNALTSFDMQQLVNRKDFNVIIVDDCSKKKLSETFLNKFKNIDVKYIYLDKNVGPGLARQAGIDATDADYVGFCDADDMLFDSISVANMLNTISANPDIVITCGYEENGTVENPILLPKGNDMIFMHGKAIRRQFLIYNDIRFDENLRVHEDSNILSKCFAMTRNVVNSDKFTYIWKNNKASITRRNNASYTSDSLAEYVRAMSLSMHYIKEKSSIEVLHSRLTCLISYIYGVVNSRYFDKSYTKDVEKQLALVITEYLNEIQKAPYQYWLEAMNMHTAEIFNACIDAKETLTQFINRLYKESIEDKDK